MKKLVLTLACALGVAGASFAQGTLTWTSFAGNFIGQTNTSVSPLFGGTGLGGTAGNTAGGATMLVYYELLYNTSFTGSQAASPTFGQLFGGTWLDSGLTATNGANSNGRINPLNYNVNTAPVPWSPGTTDNIILVGWSANLGSSWAAVSNELATGSYTTVLAGAAGFFGVSVTGYLTPGATGNPGPTVFNASPNANGLPINNPIGSPAQLYLLPVPEPSTIALAGLSGLSLLLFRRRK